MRRRNADDSGPFCFIGYKNLNTAILKAQSQGIPFQYDLEFKPFLLDPTLGSEPVVKRQRYEEKFGANRQAAMEKAMIERGKAVGIDL
jgi:predicted DsbA family dithiol-disulfide isomerase